MLEIEDNARYRADLGFSQSRVDFRKNFKPFVDLFVQRKFFCELSRVIMQTLFKSNFLRRRRINEKPVKKDNFRRFLKNFEQNIARSPPQKLKGRFYKMKIIFCGKSSYLTTFFIRKVVRNVGKKVRITKS